MNFMIFPRAMLASAVICILAGCSKPRQLAGQVFIVTRNGNSVKLGLAEVRLLDRKTFDDALKMWKELIESDGRQMQVLKSQSDALLEASKVARHRAESNRAYDSLAAEALQTWLDAESDYRAAIAYQPVLLSAVPIFAILEKVKAVAITKTDADGNFLLEIPSRGSFVIAATAGRELIGDGEFYFWTIAVPDAPKVTLSNDNLSTASDGASLMKTRDITQRDVQSNPGNRLDDLQKRIELRTAKLLQQSAVHPLPLPTPRQISIPQQSADTPIEYSPLPTVSPPSFVKLTKAFILVNAKGREIRTLPSGKRLRVISRAANEVIVDSYGENFSIPAAITEPSQ